jgi:hypothetical protein
MAERSGQDRRRALPDPLVEVEPDQTDTSVETPAEDALEQLHEAAEQAGAVPARDVPLDVDPADLAEQAREVPEDDDEYR